MQIELLLSIGSIFKRVPALGLTAGADAEASHSHEQAKILTQGGGRALT